MRRCDLMTGGSRIRDSLETIETVWNDIRDDWNDAVSRRFREHHLDMMIPRVKLGLDAISRMSLLLDEAERDCES